MVKDSKRVRTSRELKDLKERSFDELVAHAGSIARGYEWLSKTIISKFVQSFIKEKDQSYEDIEKEQEEDIVKEEKSRNELEAKRKEMKNKKNSEDKNKKRSLVKKKQVEESYPERELPVEFRKRIQELKGCDVVLVMDKELTKSDVVAGLGRLSIPLGKIKNEFLTKEEHKIVNKDKKIEVILIEPCLAVSRLCFKMWRMSNSSIYVLVSCWQNVVHNPDNGLVVIKGKKSVRVQLWAFRAGSKRRLCFALVNVGPVLPGQASKLGIAGDHGATTSSSNGGDGTSSSQPNGDLASISGDSGTLVQPQQRCSP